MYMYVHMHVHLCVHGCMFMHMQRGDDVNLDLIFSHQSDDLNN